MDNTITLYPDEEVCSVETVDLSDTEHRVLWLDSEVSLKTMTCVKNIMDWNRQDIELPVEERQPIRIMFFSYGGELDVNNSIIDAIQLSKTPVYGYNMGVAYSAACYIFMACHKRYAAPSSKFLLHGGSCELAGTYNDMSSYIEDYNSSIAEIKKFVKKRSTISDEELEDRFRGEWFVSAADAMEKYGFVDKIITSFDEVWSEQTHGKNEQ